MMKHEFEDKLKEISVAWHISDKDYKLVEYVYTFHPAISETHGKAQVAWLYNEFGIRIFKDMYPTAVKAENAQAKIDEARRNLTKALDEYEDLRKGEEEEVDI